MFTDDEIDPDVVESSIYSILMRIPSFVYGPLTWDQEWRRVNQELDILNTIVRNDMKRYATHVYQMTLEQDPLRKEHLSRCIPRSLNQALESAKCKEFAELRCLIVYRALIQFVETRYPLVCTEQMRETLEIAKDRFMMAPVQLMQYANQLHEFGFSSKLPSSP